MNRLTNIIIIGLLFLIVGSFLADQNSSTSATTTELKYSDFMVHITDGNVKSLLIDEGELKIFGEDNLVVSSGP